MPDYGPYRTTFSLQGVPVSDNFVDRPSDTAKLERCLLPRSNSAQKRRRIFVLHGLGGIGKTQLTINFARRHQATYSSVFWLDGRSEDRLRQSLAGCAKRIPEGQIPERSRNIILNNEDDLNIVVADVMGWLARPDNVNWLLIFDNVDLDDERAVGDLLAVPGDLDGVRSGADRRVPGRHERIAAVRERHGQDLAPRSGHVHRKAVGRN